MLAHPIQRGPDPDKELAWNNDLSHRAALQNCICDAVVEGLGLATPKATVLALDEHGHE